MVEERLREKVRQVGRGRGIGEDGKLADRTTRIAGSPTMKVTATVDRLRRSGVEVIDFGAGEPDFSDAGRRSKSRRTRRIDANFTKYTPVGGIADLKKAICDRYRADYGVDYQETAGHRHRRRQAGAVQHRAGAVRAGRRGDHPRAVLADDSRAGQAGRRDAGARRARTRKTASRSAPSAMLDAVTPRTRGIIVNSPVQSDRCADRRRRDLAHRWGSRRAAGTSGWSSISATRS